MKVKLVTLSLLFVWIMVKVMSEGSGTEDLVLGDDGQLAAELVETQLGDVNTINDDDDDCLPSDYDQSCDQYFWGQQPGLSQQSPQ